MSDYTAVPETSAAAGTCICSHKKHAHWMTQSAIAANGGHACTGKDLTGTYPTQCKCGGFVAKPEPTVAVNPIVQLVQQQAIIDSLRHFIQGLMAGQALAAQVVAEEGGNYWVKAYKLFAKSQEKKHV